MSGAITKRLVLIDGKSVFYRGYYAMGALSLQDGTPTGGVYGFAAISMEIVKKLNPTKVVVAWDSKTSTSKRRALFKDYKAGRIKPGEDFYTQIPLLEELVKNLGWSFVEIEDYEADDIIGTLSKQADDAGDWETYIISSDLDMLQIVDSNTHMWRILKGFTNIEQINVPEVEAKYGIKKSQFLDLKALKGDSSDNIPGVPGIGEKSAVKLLNEYDTLENIYDNLDKITGSTKLKLEAGKDSAFLSKKLAKIMFDAPVKLSNLPDFHFDRDKIINGLQKLEFKSLIRKMGGEALRNVSFEILRDDGSGKSEEPHNDGCDEACREINILSARKDIIINWNVKSLMHNDDKVASEILSGTSFWDLSQATFLLNPLSRDDSQLQLTDLEEEYHRQIAEYEQNPKLYKVLTEFDLPLIPVLYKMEKKGMLIDRDYFKNLEKEYQKEVGVTSLSLFTVMH